MRRFAAILSGLLALQIAGAIALGVTGPAYDAFRPSEPLIAFDSDKLDEVAIHGEDGTAVLRRSGENWVLPDLHDFPADADKVAKLLDRLAGMKRGLPVATSAGAPARFKVTEDTFERRIVLSSDGSEVGELLIGTSPSFRQVHVRTPSDEAVYSVEFALYEAGAKANDWTDREFLKLDAEEIREIQLPEVTLVKDEEGFTLADLSEGESLDRKAVDDLAEKILNLRFAGIEGRGEDALARLAEPEITVTLLRGEADEVLTLRLKKVEESEDYLLARSDHDYLFRATKYAVSDIAEAKRDGLLEQQQDSSLSQADSEASGKGAS